MSKSNNKGQRLSSQTTQANVSRIQSAVVRKHTELPQRVD